MFKQIEAAPETQQKEEEDEGLFLAGCHDVFSCAKNCLATVNTRLEMCTVLSLKLITDPYCSQAFYISRQI